jgi:predicted ATPase
MESRPARQRTLRSSFKWCYQLVDAQKQCLSQRLSVFTGGCTCEFAAAVCAALNGEEGVWNLLGRVALLLDKSPLQAIHQDGKQSLMVLLETIREYGLE